VRFTWKS